MNTESKIDSQGVLLYDYNKAKLQEYRDSLRAVRRFVDGVMPTDSGKESLWYPDERSMTSMTQRLIVDARNDVRKALWDSYFKATDLLANVDANFNSNVRSQCPVPEDISWFLGKSDADPYRNSDLDYFTASFLTTPYRKIVQMYSNMFPKRFTDPFPERHGLGVYNKLSTIKELRKFGLLLHFSEVGRLFSYTFLFPTESTRKRFKELGYDFEEP